MKPPHSCARKLRRLQTIYPRRLKEGNVAWRVADVAVRPWFSCRPQVAGGHFPDLRNMYQQLQYQPSGLPKQPGKHLQPWFHCPAGITADNVALLLCRGHHQPNQRMRFGNSTSRCQTTLNLSRHQVTPLNTCQAGSFQSTAIHAGGQMACQRSSACRTFRYLASPSAGKVFDAPGYLLELSE